MAHRKRIRGSARETEGDVAASGHGERKSARPATVDSWRRDAERRILTILVVDIVDSTVFARRLDPEDLADLLNAFHATCSRLIERFGGCVAKDLGDGIAAYFGWPESHEHDAERAVLCGVAAIEAVKAVPTGSLGRIRLHVGIATGEVVVGDVLRMASGPSHEVFGQLPSLAMRLQAACPPDSVLISAATHQLVHNQFVCTDAGRKRLKGFPESTLVYQVIGARALSLNFDARRAGGLTPFIGRTAELEVLTDRWRQAAAGRGPVVLLSGEAGIGKSRLCAEWRASLDEQAAASFSFQCSPLHGDHPLYPVTRLIAQIAGLANDGSPDAKWQKLAALFDGAGDDRLEGIALLATYLGVPMPTDDRPESLTSQPLMASRPPKRRRMLLHQLLTNYFLARARRHPVLIVFEDIHWMDPTTAEFLGTLIDRIQGAPVLLLLTARPQFALPWQEPVHFTHLTLDRLTRGQATQFVDVFSDTAALSADLVAQLVERSDGNPLYIEELTATVLGSRGVDGADRVANTRIQIPSTLRESLLARIDRTSPEARELMQVCAVVGRRFSHPQISAIAEMGGSELDQTLAELIRQGLLQSTGEPPDVEYCFKHALVQDAAYSLILREKRQRLHARCAAALEAHFPSVCEHEPSVLGLHHEIANNAAAAVPYVLAAGQLAIERSALREATSYLQKGLALLETLPASETRDRDEQNFRSIFGRVCIFANGWAHPSVKKEYGRALELAKRVGSKKEQFPLEWALTTSHLLRGEIRKAATGGQRVVGLAEQAEDHDLLHVAHSAMAIYDFYAGNFAGVLAHKEAALHYYREQGSQELQKNYGTDRVLQALRGAALAHWCLGDHQLAIALDEEQRSRPKNSGHVFDYVYALTISCILHGMRRDAQMTRALAEEAIRIAQDQGFSFLQANATNFLTIASVLQNPSEATLRDCDQAINDYQAAGNRMGISSMLAIIAEPCSRIGLHQRGLKYVDKALDYVRRSGERFALSDLYRVRGELLVDLNRTSDAQHCLNQAVQTARKQQAKTWELAAAVPLAQILLDRGASGEALRLLQPPLQKFDDSEFFAELLARAQRICAQCSASERPIRSITRRH
jgi:predicted ATPase/class 3 adenylate cyclase/predicted negative regulator of RcsB-dependent stress response